MPRVRGCRCCTSPRCWTRRIATLRRLRVAPPLTPTLSPEGRGQGEGEHAASRGRCPRARPTSAEEPRRGMARVKVLDLAALPDGAVELAVMNGLDVAVFRRGDEILAIGNECAHTGGNLCDGFVEGDIVTCPLHGWEFDLR